MLPAKEHLSAFGPTASYRDCGRQNVRQKERAPAPGLILSQTRHARPNQTPATITSKRHPAMRWPPKEKPGAPGSVLCGQEPRGFAQGPIPIKPSFRPPPPKGGLPSAPPHRDKSLRARPRRRLLGGGVQKLPAALASRPRSPTSPAFRVSSRQGREAGRGSRR